MSDDTDKDRLERIATAAMQGILSGPMASEIGVLADDEMIDATRCLALGSVDYARALIAELDKEEP